MSNWLARCAPYPPLGGRWNQLFSTARDGQKCFPLFPFGSDAYLCQGALRQNMPRQKCSGGKINRSAVTAHWHFRVPRRVLQQWKMQTGNSCLHAIMFCCPPWRSEMACQIDWPAAHPTRPWVEGEISSLAQRAMARNVSPFFLLDLMPTYAKGHWGKTCPDRSAVVAK